MSLKWLWKGCICCSSTLYVEVHHMTKRHRSPNNYRWSRDETAHLERIAQAHPSLLAREVAALHVANWPGRGPDAAFQRVCLIRRRLGRPEATETVTGCPAPVPAPAAETASLVLEIRLAPETLDALRTLLSQTSRERTRTG
jgi:hypothetical protein